MRTFEYLLTAVIVLAGAYLIITPIVEGVATSLNDSADMITEATSR